MNDRVRRAALEWLGVVVAVLVLTAAMRALVGQAFYIPSASMVPQLQVGDRIVVSKLAYRLHDPRRGDVVVFDAPPGEQGAPEPHRPAAVRFLLGLVRGLDALKPQRTEFVKRVVALPGEEVEGRDGHVYVDGHLLVEPYLAPTVVTSDFGPVRVPPDRLWVMGDNRPNSGDSRVFGPIPEDSVVGRVIAKAWPPGSASWLWVGGTVLPTT